MHTRNVYGVLRKIAAAVPMTADDYKSAIFGMVEMARKNGWVDPDKINQVVDGLHDITDIDTLKQLYDEASGWKDQGTSVDVYGQPVNADGTLSAPTTGNELKNEYANKRVTFSDVLGRARKRFTRPNIRQWLKDNQDYLYAGGGSALAGGILGSLAAKKNRVLGGGVGALLGLGLGIGGNALRRYYNHLESLPFEQDMSGASNYFSQPVKPTPPATNV